MSLSVPIPARPEGRSALLPAADLDRLRMALAQQKSALDEQMRSASATLAQLREEFTLTDPDVQTPLMTALHELDHAERSAIDVADALARIEAGSYGVCRQCGGAIRVERLELRPAARFCVSCGG